MSISLYDVSVSNYLQILRAMEGVLAKGAEFYPAQGRDLNEVLETKLRDDMLPFRFQLISVVHHSLGAINGIKGGIFTPPPSMPDVDYAGFQALVADAITQLEALSQDEVNGLSEQALKFKLGDFEMPFIGQDFVLSFSLPNFYFHATTAYDMLRIDGVPLGKKDFLGAMRMAS
ncbi:DUF1993 domain-containing protein [Oceanicoccus sagamiensis]|uniref:DUF1993 domain-containing protein n=1 Tax=Oceanicoccus sagamiensis TaxID=716816 RepID=A0A1X9ND60_9GAMM|nr:DUF1993 domain-containing protein [Oceanicoccus sagamiensis]ARN72897.1 hypothetical protein BST96_01515 [Oceanicoccus sagamiensis]